MAAHKTLVAKTRRMLRAAGFPIVLTKAFSKETPSHQCGTVRFGHDPAEAPLDPYCKAFDLDNLYVVDASFFPSSAAVNPALTVAAQALRAGEPHRAPVDRAALAGPMTDTSISTLDSRPVALVTGARRGIGAAIAVELAAAPRRMRRGLHRSPAGRGRRSGATRHRGGRRPGALRPERPCRSRRP